MTVAMNAESQSGQKTGNQEEETPAFTDAEMERLAKAILALMKAELRLENERQGYV